VLVFANYPTDDGLRDLAEEVAATSPVLLDDRTINQTEFSVRVDITDGATRDVILSAYPGVVAPARLINVDLGLPLALRLLVEGAMDRPVGAVLEELVRR